MALCFTLIDLFKAAFLS